MSGNKEVKCESLASLPPMDMLSAHRIWVTLPVVVLAVLKPPTWLFGFLLVTDFTSVFDSAFYKDSVPASVPTDFTVGAYKVPRSQIFTISVRSDTADAAWKQLAKFSPRVQQKYDYRDTQKCVVASEGIVCYVNFLVKSYRGCIEGFLGKITAYTRQALDSPTHAAYFEEKDISKFMRRYCRHVLPPLYWSLKQLLPIEKFMAEPMRSVPPPLRHREHDDLLTQAHVPKRRVTGPQVTFRQISSQAVAEMAAPKPAQTAAAGAKNSAVAAATYSAGNPPPRAAPSNDAARGPSSVTTPQLLVSQAAFMVSPCDFLALCRTPCHTVDEGSRFRTHCAVVLVPLDVFIKPFMRTVKVRPVRMVLGTSESVAAEIHNDDVSKFFGVAEIEELINDLAGHGARLRSLEGKSVHVEVERKSLVMGLGQHLPYWACRSTLAELLASVK